MPCALIVARCTTRMCEMCLFVQDGTFIALSHILSTTPDIISDSWNGAAYPLPCNAATYTARSSVYFNVCPTAVSTVRLKAGKPAQGVSNKRRRDGDTTGLAAVAHGSSNPADAANQSQALCDDAGAAESASLLSAAGIPVDRLGLHFLHGSFLSCLALEVRSQVVQLLQVYATATNLLLLTCPICSFGMFLKDFDVDFF